MRCPNPQCGRDIPYPSDKVVVVCSCGYSVEPVLRYAKRMLEPLLPHLVPLRAATNGIVFIINSPPAIANKAAKALGVKLAGGKPTVFGMTCENAVTAVGGQRANLQMRLWVSRPPAENQVKIFMVGPGAGTALLTVGYEGNRVVGASKELDPEDVIARDHSGGLLI